MIDSIATQESARRYFGLEVGHFSSSVTFASTMFPIPIQLDAPIGTAADGTERPGKREHRHEKTSGSVGVGTFISSMCFL
ncbi:MAG: hypothetical protein WBW38_05020 [Candidatus Sulfotelmatobacter sp.]